MKIIIPSLGRSNACPTSKWIQQAGREVVFAVHSDELEAYSHAYPWATVGLVPDSCRKHTGKLRKYILDNMEEPFFFCDDDISIGVKSNQTVKEIFDVLENHIKCGASMAGLGQQLFSNAQIDKTTIINGDAWALRNQFVATVYGIDPKVFRYCPLEELAVYEDVALIIHAIQRGGGTITSYMATHTNKSPDEGGCNAWRDKPIIVECLNKLVELYPGICSIRDTYSTTHSQYIGIGLRVAWSKIKKVPNGK